MIENTMSIYLFIFSTQLKKSTLKVKENCLKWEINEGKGSDPSKLGQVSMGHISPIHKILK